MRVCLHMAGVGLAPDVCLLMARWSAGAPGVTSQVDDRLYAWEAMSLLLAADALPEAEQAHVLRGLLHFLCLQVRLSRGLIVSQQVM